MEDITNKKAASIKIFDFPTLKHYTLHIPDQDEVVYPSDKASPAIVGLFESIKCTTVTTFLPLAAVMLDQLQMDHNLSIILPAK